MFKIVLGFFLVFGAIVCGQKYWQSWVIQRVADMPPSETFPTTQIGPATNFDAGRLRQGINPLGTTPAYLPATRR